MPGQSDRRTMLPVDEGIRDENKEDCMSSAHPARQQVWKLRLHRSVRDARRFANGSILGCLLEHGRSTKETAARRGVSEGTMRVQLKSPAAKMHCRRQSETVAIVVRWRPWMIQVLLAADLSAAAGVRTGRRLRINAGPTLSLTRTRAPGRQSRRFRT